MAHGRALTIQEIARRAGVGVGTVSRVLNDSPNVSPATRAVVRQVMADLNYRPKMAAKTLRTRRSGSLAFLTDQIASTPYAGDTIRGAQEAAWRNDTILVTVDTNNDERLLEAAIEAMLDRQVDGLIFATFFHRAVNVPATINRLPAVLVDCFVEDCSLPSVVPDEVSGGRTATEVLLRQGHRRIGLINNDEFQPARFGREQGYADALADYGIAVDPQLITYQGSTAAAGYAGVKVLMALPQPPTAIFCFNDRTAMGAYDALRKLDLRVPQDVAIVGFDDQEIIAANLHPGLTTMRLPHYDMGVWAVNYLLEEAQASPFPDASPPQVKLACPLIMRESHGSLREEV